MYKVTIKTVLLAAGLTTCGLAAAGGRGTPVSLPPTIVKTSVDMKENVIIITGRNFGATPPTVLMANQALDVKRFSEHEVVASLPHDLISATYGITVITTGIQNRARSNLFSATLFGGDYKTK